MQHFVLFHINYKCSFFLWSRNKPFFLPPMARLWIHDPSTFECVRPESSPPSPSCTVSLVSWRVILPLPFLTCCLWNPVPAQLGSLCQNPHPSLSAADTIPFLASPSQPNMQELSTQTISRCSFAISSSLNFLKYFSSKFSCCISHMSFYLY